MVLVPADASPSVNRPARRSRTATAALAAWNVPASENGPLTSASTRACSGGSAYEAASGS